MAKMFYSLEEVAEKLSKSEEEVREMARSGQIQEFRDGEKLMFKVDQIDLLAGGDEDTGEVSLDLEDTSGASGLELESSAAPDDTGEKPASDSGIPLSDTGGGTGSAMGLEQSSEEESPQVDASEQTHVGGETQEDLSLESVGSGSGLLDLTRESDDTTLGAELLEEVYSSDDNVEIPANASGLFEASAEDTSEAPAIGGGGGAAGAMPVMYESYDGTWSGAGVGLMLGALVSLICVGIMAVVAISGATPALATIFAENIWVWVGGLAGVTLIAFLIGWFIGKASE